MQYALLIYNQPDAMATLSPDEGAALSQEFWAIRDDPSVIGGSHLTPVQSATTLRANDGPPLITDGPFADTKEVLSGFYLVEADDLDVALAVAARIPIFKLGGSVEVRPIVPPPPGHSYASGDRSSATVSA